MALLFELPGGEEWRTGMNAIPVFNVRTPEAFRDLLVASAHDLATGKPDPAKMSVIASWSERLLYTLLFALPLVGWGMLSAGHYPIVLFGSVHLPPILPASPMLYAVLRRAHTVLAYLLFATFVAHMTAVLFHTIVLRDGLLRRMTR